MLRAAFILTLMLFSLSCRPDRHSERLIGAWRYDAAATKALMEKEGASASEVNYMESILNSLAQGILEFQDEGKLVYRIGDLEQEGTWRLNRNGRELRMNWTGEQQLSHVRVLTPDTLILEPRVDAGLHFPRVLFSVDMEI